MLPSYINFRSIASSYYDVVNKSWQRRYAPNDERQDRPPVGSELRRVAIYAVEPFRKRQ